MSLPENLVNLGTGSLGFGPVNPPVFGPLVSLDTEPPVIGSSFGSFWLGLL